jgi:hypothetical protein
MYVSRRAILPSRTVQTVVRYSSSAFPFHLPVLCNCSATPSKPMITCKTSSVTPRSTMAWARLRMPETPRATPDRLMAIQKGKNPAPLVNTTEETAAPVTACGPREIAFMIGPEPHETIAFAEPASGRVAHTIAPGKGPVDSISCSPDGKTVYFAARGVIWGIPSSGSLSGNATRKIHAGDGVVADPSGRRLIVQVQENLQLHRFSVPLDGGPEREAPADGSFPVAPLPLSPNALRTDGRLLTSLLLADSWFNPPGVIDTVTGRITRIPSDNLSDFQSIGWTPDGQVMALGIGLRATLWKFQPVSR